jgi:peptide/nickel transport system substrate-binding protein
MNTPVDKVGTYNVGNYSNPKIDALTTQVETEVDPAKRNALIFEAMTLDKEDYGHIPLHQAGLAWGVRKGVHVVQRSDDSLELKWVTID